MSNYSQNSSSTDADAAASVTASNTSPKSASATVPTNIEYATAANTDAPSKLDKAVLVIGSIASALSVIMYVSYIPQIANNLAGHPGNPIQPLAAMFNCIMWTAYGLLSKKKQWPIIIANAPGIFLAATAFVTALV